MTESTITVKEQQQKAATMTQEILAHINTHMSSGSITTSDVIAALELIKFMVLDNHQMQIRMSEAQEAQETEAA